MMTSVRVSGIGTKKKRKARTEAGSKGGKARLGQDVESPWTPTDKSDGVD